MHVDHSVIHFGFLLMNYKDLLLYSRQDSPIINLLDKWLPYLETLNEMGSSNPNCFPFYWYFFPLVQHVFFSFFLSLFHLKRGAIFNLKP